MVTGTCEDICKDVLQTAMNRLPVVCELLRHEHLFADGSGVGDLHRALLV